jgi:hypothetical protein
MTVSGMMFVFAGGDDIGFYVVATASTRAKLNRCGDSITTTERTILTI